MILFIIATILFLDRLTKFLITQKIILYESLPVIKGIFHLTLVHNRGAAFGILRGQIILLIITSALSIVLIFRNLRCQGKKGLTLYSFSLSLILAGATGNLIDRLFLGYVIDFLDFRIWPVFNIADSAITFGAILLGYSILKKPDPSDQ